MEERCADTSLRESVEDRTVGLVMISIGQCVGSG